MSIKIIATTDVHGHLLDYRFLDQAQTGRGLSRLSTYLKSQRQLHDVIYIDNGDINQGTPLVAYSNVYVEENIAAKALNLLKCDYFNLGNHDFNFGSLFLKRYIDQNQAKCITANIDYQDQSVGYTQIKEIRNKKIAFIGAVTDHIPNWEAEKNLVNIAIHSTLNTVKREVEKVRNIVDYVIVVYHGGFEKNIETGIPSENLTGENVGYQICDEIEGIDVLITGHQHRNLLGKIKNTWIVQCNDTCNQCMEIEIDDEIKVSKVDLSSVEIDLDFESHFNHVLQDTEKWLDQEIGYLDQDYPITNIEKAQLNKHPITSFLNQIFLEYFNADISACCLFDVMPGLSKNLKYRDIILNAPFPNTLVLKKVTGKQLLIYLNQLASYWTVIEDKITINPKFIIPKREIYNYDLLDGISYTINVSKTKDNFVGEVLFKGKPLDLNQEFKLVINNYRASGGGNFSYFPNIETLVEDTNDVSDVIIEYVKKKKNITISHQNNIKLQIVE